MREWLPEDDLAHFVVEAVERVPLGAFRVNERGTGSAQYHPRMMLALLIYCYTNGIFGSRRIERRVPRCRAPASQADCQIAAIARSQSMTVATRNVRDFMGTGIEVIDPWEL